MAQWTKHNIESITKVDDLMRLYLINARKESGITQTELGRRMGLSRSAICRVESGDVSNTLVSYYRYLPKIFKWVKCCGGVLRLGFVILNEKEK